LYYSEYEEKMVYLTLIVYCYQGGSMKETCNMWVSLIIHTHIYITGVWRYQVVIMQNP